MNLTPEQTLERRREREYRYRAVNAEKRESEERAHRRLRLVAMTEKMIAEIVAIRNERCARLPVMKK